jgi:predicted MPP superfamily phosphohydrolase
MILFLLVFFCLYGSLHLYIFLKVDAALTLGPIALFLVLAFQAVMVVTPVLVHVIERRGLGMTARLLSQIGYMWMGLAFLFFSFSLLVDLYGFCLRAVELLLVTDLSPVRLSPQLAFFIPGLLALLIAFYGYREASHIRTETMTIASGKIPENTSPITVVLISDIHLGLVVGKARLKRIVKGIENAKPDLLVSAGDLVDGQTENLIGLADALCRITPGHGKLAVTGNHEFYAGLKGSLDFTKRAGFRMLRGEALIVAGVIGIAGVDDPTGGYFGLDQGSSERSLLSPLPRELFTLLLKHRPVVNETSLGLFDLQLSGHTHKGQIFPFALITRLFFSTPAGFKRLPHGSAMYVTRGAGTWGPPIRFLAPPEITVIRLVHSS